MNSYIEVETDSLPITISAAGKAEESEIRHACLLSVDIVPFTVFQFLNRLLIGCVPNYVQPVAIMQYRIAPPQFCIGSIAGVHNANNVGGAPARRNCPKGE